MQTGLNLGKYYLEKMIRRTYKSSITWTKSGGIFESFKSGKAAAFASPCINIFKSVYP